jgi:hypothetical protein
MSEKVKKKFRIDDAEGVVWPSNYSGASPKSLSRSKRRK